MHGVGWGVQRPVLRLRCGRQPPSRGTKTPEAGVHRQGWLGSRKQGQGSSQTWVQACAPAV